MPYFALKIWRYAESPYLCNVFFIVLDLRLTKDWLSGIDSLFLCLFLHKLRRSHPKLFLEYLGKV
jgi:hypothetical protein